MCKRDRQAMMTSLTVLAVLVPVSIKAESIVLLAIGAGMALHLWADRKNSWRRRP